MARFTIRRTFSAALFLFVTLFLPAAPVLAQDKPVLTGVVADESGGLIIGATIKVLDSAGVVVQTTTSDAAGRFAVRVLAPGGYSVRIEAPMFTASEQRVTVSASGAALALQIVLKTGGLAESVVVTAQRVETRLAETPQKIEVVENEEFTKAFDRLPAQHRARVTVLLNSGERLLAAPDEQHARALVAQPLRHSEPDPARRPGDDAHLAGKPQVHTAHARTAGRSPGRPTWRPPAPL